MSNQIKEMLHIMEGLLPQIEEEIEELDRISKMLDAQLTQNEKDHERLRKLKELKVKNIKYVEARQLGKQQYELIKQYKCLLKQKEEVKEYKELYTKMLPTERNYMRMTTDPEERLNQWKKN